MTSLKPEGNIVITFTANVYAGAEIYTNGIDSTWELALTNTTTWKYDDGIGEGSRDVVALNAAHNEAHLIVWTSQGNGVFTYTISADDFADHIVFGKKTLI